MDSHCTITAPSSFSSASSSSNIASSSAVLCLCLGNTSSTLLLIRSSGADNSGTRCGGKGMAVELVDRADEGTISGCQSPDLLRLPIKQVILARKPSGVLENTHS